MSRTRRFTWGIGLFTVGVSVGARLECRATRFEVAMARASGYLQGGLRASEITGEVYREQLEERRQRRWWR